MAKSKEEVKYGTAQAKLSEDEALRVRYKAGTPLEGGKIADSQSVDLFAAAQDISKPSSESHPPTGDENTAAAPTGQSHADSNRRR